MGGSCANRRLKIDRGTSLTRILGQPEGELRSSLRLSMAAHMRAQSGQVDWNRTEDRPPLETAPYLDVW